MDEIYGRYRKNEFHNLFLVFAPDKLISNYFPSIRFSLVGKCLPCDIGFAFTEILLPSNPSPPIPIVQIPFLSRNIFFDFFFLSIQRKEKRLKDDWPRLSLVLIVQYEIKQDERQAVLSRRKELASTEIIFSPNESRRARV